MSTVANAAAEARAVTGGEEILDEARRVLRMEAEAVGALGPRLGDSFLRAVDLIRSRVGMVILSGVGKSGLIARKVAATLTSTGTPAVFLHPVDGLHGDVGIANSGNVLVVLSRSGATEELNGLLAFAELRGMPVVAMVGDTASPLARQAAAVLDCGVAVEACPMDLAPTSSTTATLAMGDALAVALLRRRGFRPADFASLHPGGSLGRRLTLRVRDVMVAEDYPAVREDATVRNAIVPLARMRGTVPVIDGANKLVGVVTAGDVARLMEHTEDFLGLAVSTFMTRTPRIARPDELGAAALRRMEEHGVMALPVVGDSGLEGIVHLHDLMRAGVV